MNDLTKKALAVAATIQNEVSELWLPPDEGVVSKSEPVLAISQVRGTKGYIVRVVHQINAAYANACYDCCAVMIRRLIETLIIETYEKYQISDRIETARGLMPLSELIDAMVSEKTWTLGSRFAKPALLRLKEVGDRSAHDRRFNAHRSDIDKLIPDIRTVVQELVGLAGLK